jgi:hypothetical protein
MHQYKEAIVFHREKKGLVFDLVIPEVIKLVCN